MSGGIRIASIDGLPAQYRDQAMKQLGLRVNGRQGEGQYGAKPPPPHKRKDSEHPEQVSFFEQIREMGRIDKRYALAAARTFAIPNGGGRSKREAGRLKAEGVTPGVSDTLCAMPSGEFHGLFIEMKSLTGYPSREQRKWIADSVNLGYAAACCRGAAEAVATWKAYVDATT